MSKFIAFVTAFVAALVARFKRVEAPIDVDPYEGYEVTGSDRELLCPWGCGECRYCKEGREPDQG